MKSLFAILPGVASDIFNKKGGVLSTFIRRTIATIYATPGTTLVDETVNIKVCGLDTGSQVTVRSYLPEPGLFFEGHGHFVADVNGEVSVGEDPAKGGTYTDVEPMGLFWSMTQSPDQRHGLRFIKKDVTTPIAITLSVHKGHLGISALQTDIPVARTQIHRTYVGPDVEIIKVLSGRIRGRVFKPKGPGPFRGVIDMFGSAGGQIEFRAALLASRGFAAYALPYFKYEDLPNDFVDVDLEYFQEATEWFQNQHYVHPGGVGVCGASWGAEVAALMAATFPEKISACCSISGTSARTWTPMTYKGKVIPFLGVDTTRAKVVQETPQILNIMEVIDPLETAPEEVMIKLEKAQRLLFFVGLDDKIWKTSEFIDEAERRLKALGCTNYEIMRYPKTGHLIEPPYAPVNLVSYHRLFGGIVDCGGLPREHQRAQEDHWPRLLHFFNTYVGTHHK